MSDNSQLSITANNDKAKISWNDSTSSSDSENELTGKKNKKNLKRALSRLIESATCPVCLDRLQNSVICCVNGHATCQPCRNVGVLNNCSLCRQPFHEQIPTALTKILEKMPEVCKNPLCQEITFDIKEHEEFCVYRYTNCRKCEWAGLVKDLYYHIEEAHMFGAVDWRIPNETGHSNTYPCLIKREIFWRTTRIDYYSKIFSVHFICVPRKKIYKTFKMHVELESEKVSYIGCINLSFQSSSESSKENYICFNTNILHTFTDDFGFLKCSFRLTKC